MGKLMTAKIASCAKGCVTGVPCIEWMLCRRQQIKFIIESQSYEIKLPPRAIFRFKILEIFSDEY